MRPTFIARLVNGPLFDPILYVRMLNERRALLFDCGRFRGLADRELLAVETICISHAHMNHFMGFDEVLRTVLHREDPLLLIGPEGIAEKCLSKLRAYTWNLSGTYDLEIRILEVGREYLRTVSTRADTGFGLFSEDVSPRIGNRVAETPRYYVEAAVMDHGGIPCLGYALKETFHVNIRKGALEGKGYLPGPWIGELKVSILTGRLEENIPVTTNSGIAGMRAGDLKEEIVILSPGQAVAFVTDIAFTEDNLESLEAVAKGADTLFIEAFYLGELERDACEKGHLTAVQAGMIARRLHAGQAFPMHVSPRYHHRIDDIYGEMGIAKSGHPVHEFSDSARKLVT